MSDGCQAKKSDRHGRAKTVSQPVAEFRFVMGESQFIAFWSEMLDWSGALQSWKEASGAQILAQWALLVPSRKSP
jgi:hypothetical protein